MVEAILNRAKLITQICFIHKLFNKNINFIWVLLWKLEIISSINRFLPYQPFCIIDE